MWLFGAAALSVPAGYYLYRRHVLEAQQTGPIVLPDLSKNYDGAIVLESLKGDVIQEGKPAGPTISVEPSHLRAKYLLIGGGLASFSAMESILVFDDHADILMVTEEAYPPYMRPPLAKELWYNHDVSKDLDENFEFADWHGERKPIFFQDATFYDFPLNKDSPSDGRKAKLITGRRVVSIDADRRVATLHDGTQIEFEKALIATGSSPRMLDQQLDPNAMQNISQLRKITDFKRIRKVVDTADHIAIIGGGFIGSELAACISAYSEISRPKRPLRITQIFPEEGNMGLVFPKYLSTWAMKQLRSLGVDIWPSTGIKMVSRLADDKVRVETTSPEGNKTLDVDHVIVAIGAEPNSAIAQGTSMAIDLSEFGAGGLKASEALELVPGTVFGAGDVISFFDESLGLWRRVEHYDHALNSGRVAGQNMTKTHPSEYQPYRSISIFWSDLGPTIGYEAVGLVDSSLTTVGVWAKARKGDTPTRIELDTSDVRTESVGQTSPGSVEPIHGDDVNAVQKRLLEAFDSEEYRKGLVLYVLDRKVVGMLMFNLFNRTALAKSIIRQQMTVDNLQDIVELFNINDK